MLKVERAAMRGWNREEAVSCTSKECWWDQRGTKFDPHQALDMSEVLIVKAKYLEADTSMYTQLPNMLVRSLINELSTP